MKQGTQPGVEASPVATSMTAVASASAITPSPKATARRKKGSQACGDNERRDEGKPRSTSAVRSGPANLFLNALGDRLSNLPDKEGTVINGSLVSVAGDRPPRNSARKPKACVPTLEDALDDVQVRFVLNLPEAELSSADRLFFQLEQAWWFYEDFIADAHKHLPHFKLKEFAKLLFEHCEALRPLSGKYNELFEHFRSWKGTIPTAGCILLNPAMTKVVLVKSWKGNNRGLPKGKINQGEPAIAAAIREVKEETGFDASGIANERDFLTFYRNGQQTTHYIVTGVDEGFAFEPQVRKEISAVEWFPLDALPKGCYGVEPFVPRLRRWMAKARGMRAPKDATADARTQSLIRVRKGRATSPDMSEAAASALAAGQETFPVGAAAVNGNGPSKKYGRKGGKGAGGKGETGRACSAPSRRNHVKGCDANNRDTFGGYGLDDANGDGWGVEDMFAANERLTGRTFVYDGNPHEFGEPARAPAQTQAQTPASRFPGCAPAAPTEPARGNSREVREGYRKERGGQTQQQRQKQQQQSEVEELAGLSIDSEFAFLAEKEGSGYEVDKKVEDGRSRNRGKTAATARGVSANARANASEAAEEASAACGISTSNKSGLEEGLDGAGSSGWGSRAIEGKICPRVADSPCTGGTGREGDAPGAATMWGVSSGGSKAGGAGLFGEFKFDMVDIMSVVPRV